MSGLRRLAPRLLALAAVAALVGWVLGSRARGGSFEQARSLFQRGTTEDLRVAGETLAAGSGDCLLAARALSPASRDRSIASARPVRSHHGSSAASSDPGLSDPVRIIIIVIGSVLRGVQNA